MYSGEVEYFDCIGDDLGIPPLNNLINLFIDLNIRDARRRANDLVAMICDCESLGELEDIIYENCSTRNYSWDLSDDTDKYTDFFCMALYSAKQDYILRVYKD